MQGLQPLAACSTCVGCDGGRVVRTRRGAYGTGPLSVTEERQQNPVVDASCESGSEYGQEDVGQQTL